MKNIFSKAKFEDHFTRSDGKTLLFWHTELCFGLDEEGNPLKYYILIDEKRAYRYDKYGKFVPSNFDPKEKHPDIVI